VNVSGLARDAATSRTTIDGYLGILEDTFASILDRDRPGPCRAGTARRD
jgi:hypothetical protein